MMCIIAWRVLWMCQLNRVSPELPASLVFTETEMKLLEHLQPMKAAKDSQTIGDFVIRLAKLGGYLGRTRDSPPGNMVSLARHDKVDRHTPWFLSGPRCG
jgi:hypothetical protein